MHYFKYAEFKNTFLQIDFNTCLAFTFAFGVVLERWGNPETLIYLELFGCEARLLAGRIKPLSED
jgi:hypothetical protein